MKKLFQKIKEVIQSMKTWLKIVIAVILVLGIAAGVYFGFFAPKNSGMSAANAELLASLPTVTLEEGTLTSSVGATGNVRAAQSTTLSWEVNGRVDEVLVALGDDVSEGDILAKLSEDSLPTEVISARQTLYEAEQALEDLYGSYSGLALADAELAVVDAQEALKDAQVDLNLLTSPVAQTYIDSAESALVQAADKLQKVQETWDSEWANRSTDNVNRAKAQQELAEAQQAYDLAAMEYNYLIEGATDLEVAQAEAAVAVAEQTLADAQEAYDNLLNGVLPDEIAAAEAEVSAAENELAQAWIEAPFDGTITLLYPTEGILVSSGETAFQIDDLSTMLIDVEVSEIDINTIEIGQDATVSFDAIRTTSYTGKVVSKGMAGSNSSGVVTYPVTVQVIDADDQVKPGMTATVDIIVEGGEASVLIPNQSITVVDEQQVVYVINQNGGIMMVPVTIGLSSDTYSTLAIDSPRLQAGTDIVLNPSALTANSDSEAGGMNFMIPGMGGGMGGGGGEGPREGGGGDFQPPEGGSGGAPAQ